MEKGCIVIRGARENNLKNLDIEIPRGRFTVITGISGSGKSSLAFDTLYAEGQRRFAESLSSYARQFLGRSRKPDVDSIEGIPPAVAIEQKVNVKNPRSTVATTTEIYDYLRLVYARIGHTFSPVSGEQVRCSTSADVMEFISGCIAKADGSIPVYVLSDIGWDSRQDKVELMLSLSAQGFSRFWKDGAALRLDEVMTRAEKADWPQGLLLLVDRLKAGPEPMDGDLRARLLSSVETAFRQGNGSVTAVCGEESRSFCSRFELDGITFRKPDEYLFSFNSPLGACPVCGGLGKIIGISEDLVVPDKSKSIYDGAIACWRGEKMDWFREHLVNVAPRYGLDVFRPYCELDAEQKDLIWNGHSVEGDSESIVGINEFFDWVQTQRYKIQFRFMLSRFSGRTSCGACRGTRLRKEALYVRVAGKNIAEVLDMTVGEALPWFSSLLGGGQAPAALDSYELGIAGKAIEEIVSRLQCLEDVGLSYLTLSRACNTLSGGESQRINLVTALGSSLVGSMYILDEPSIGLHSRDTERLIAVLRRLRDIGNTVIVVEHDEEIIRAADLLLDMGPLAGDGGGEIVFEGKPDGDPAPEVLSRSLTLQYISGRRQRYSREKRWWQYYIEVTGAMQNNLKDINVRFPLGVLTVVTGVSGSGKSSLVRDILAPALYRRLNDSGDLPGTHRGLRGHLDRIQRVEYVDQNPIGRSTRSNAATYLKVYDDIRKLLAQQQYARINGITAAHFSFNQEGGRCPECQGAGIVKIEMQFMADVTMVCEACGGKRFKQDVLEVRYRGKNVDDILDMSVEQAISFFAEGKEELARGIARKLQPLVDVGLGYIKLGQSSSTLSGGESQRIKLAYFLSMNEAKQKILFIFDEPTTGLHFYDVEKLLKAFDALLAGGHSLVVVEHNMDVIRAADWVIDLGPDAGDRGGRLVYEGTPEDMKNADTITAKYLWM
ncbi:MAG: excinuclease ABC subunit UvrA [Bacteroidia bacterium]|nr:excinuclease ABC subunit UvrA [Bacteroidia bacterium]